LHEPTIRGSIPGKARRSFPPTHPERPWVQPTLLFTAYRGLSSRGLQRPRSEDERSSRPSAHVRNKCSRTCTPHRPHSLFERQQFLAYSKKKCPHFMPLQCHKLSPLVRPLRHKYPVHTLPK
jgi:hypothetical protein